VISCFLIPSSLLWLPTIIFYSSDRAFPRPYDADFPSTTDRLFLSPKLLFLFCSAYPLLLGSPFKIFLVCLFVSSLNSPVFTLWLSWILYGTASVLHERLPTSSQLKKNSLHVGTGPVPFPNIKGFSSLLPSVLELRWDDGMTARVIRPFDPTPLFCIGFLQTSSILDQIR